jgi:hypothetical protein
MVRAAHFKVEVKAIQFIGPKMSAHHPKADIQQRNGHVRCFGSLAAAA